MTSNIGKFKAKSEYICSMFGRRSREVEFDVTWVSCGVYQMEYYRPRDAEDPAVLVTENENWYPPNVNISFTPEQFNKVAELYPSAPKNKRFECYKPFYENYDLDRGMFDFGDDCLFQAFKDPHENVEKVYLTSRSFVHGTSKNYISILGLYWEDFKRLKDLLDSKKDEIFYSGCRMSMS
jgi:hypothetical protein